MVGGIEVMDEIDPKDPEAKELRRGDTKGLKETNSRSEAIPAIIMKGEDSSVNIVES